MAGIISVDGVTYDVKVCVGDFSRTASILDGKNAERLQSGLMELDTIGTYYNYTITFVRAGSNVVAYDALYEVLTDPANRQHTIAMPYGQGTITFLAYVATVTDGLQKIRGGIYYWGSMAVDFTAMRPYRTP